MKQMEVFMHNKSLAQRKPSEIKAAIRREKEYAQEQDIPLTAERLAAELDMDLELFHGIVQGACSCNSRSEQQKAALIQRACGEATASVVEHAMRRGSGTNMHMLYLKNNAGYDKPKSDKNAKDTNGGQPPVVFIGEENILE
jgi:hypothetical protein